jgi:hypothetical protein
MALMLEPVPDVKDERQQKGHDGREDREHYEHGAALLACFGSSATKEAHQQVVG